MAYDGSEYCESSLCEDGFVVDVVGVRSTDGWVTADRCHGRW